MTRLPKKKCEHCGREIAITVFPRWHGDKCKQRPKEQVDVAREKMWEGFDAMSENAPTPVVVVSKPPSNVPSYTVDLNAKATTQGVIAHGSIDKFEGDNRCIQEVFDLVKKHRGEVSYTEAVLMWCEKRGIDVEYAGGIIRKHRKENVVLRVAIQKEAEELNCLKRNVA